MKIFKNSFPYAAAALSAAALLVLSGCSVQTTTTTTTSSGTVVTKNGKVVYSTMRGRALGAAKFTATDSRSASAGLSPRVAITNDLGGISVSAGAPGSAVQVRAIKHAAAQADLAKLVLVVTQSGSAVDVRLKGPSPEINNLYADLEIVAPAGAHVDETAVSGIIKTAGIGGGVNAEDSNGDITLQHIGGSVQAQSVSGSITVSDVANCRLSDSNGDVEVTRCTGDAQASSVSGAVSASDVGGKATLSSSNGNIDAAGCRGSVQAQAISGAVTVSGGGAGPLDLSSSNGDIIVEAGNYRQAISANTVSGSIRLQGSLPSLKLQTSNGDIDVATSSPLMGTNTLTAVSGSISVAVPRSSKLAVDAYTTSGSITNDFGLPVTPNGLPASMSGAINSGIGGATLSMSSSNGDIALTAS